MDPFDHLTRFAFWTLVVTGLLAVSLGILVAASVSGTGATTDAFSEPAATSFDNESAFVEPVPERGDPYYEARAIDDSWISYHNPRDEYRNPYLGHGSGKIGVTLLNERGEVIVGETVPNTTVTIPTGDALAWHAAADPIEIELPLTDQYERPLDSDQFGTAPDLPQGDGYLDSHTVEFHGLDENATVEYGEATVTGAFAHRIRVVGYIQQAPGAWNTSVDPIEDAVSYEEAGGEWTFRTDDSHGQVIVVLQVVSTADAADDANAATADADPALAIGAPNESVVDDATEEKPANQAAREADSLIGFGAALAILGWLGAIAAGRR